MFTTKYSKNAHLKSHSLKRSKFTVLVMAALLPIIATAQVREKIDRGVVALTVEEGKVYVGWRLLASDPKDSAFNVYRKDVGVGDFEKINDTPITGSSNFLDTSASPGHGYRSARMWSERPWDRLTSSH